MARPPDTGETRGPGINLRLDSKERLALDTQRAERGGMTRSAYLRYLVRLDGEKIAREKGKDS